VPGDHLSAILDPFGSGVDGSDVHSCSVASDEYSERRQVVFLDVARIRLLDVTLNLPTNKIKLGRLYIVQYPQKGINPLT